MSLDTFYPSRDPNHSWVPFRRRAVGASSHYYAISQYYLLGRNAIHPPIYVAHVTAPRPREPSHGPPAASISTTALVTAWTASRHMQLAYDGMLISETRHKVAPF